MLGDAHYLNSGDWVESMTAIVEHWDDRFELIHFTDFLKQYPMEAEENAEEEPLNVGPTVAEILRVK
jgi:hypothetical protein